MKPLTVYVTGEELAKRILAKLKNQEIFPERHPVTYSPEQVRKTLLMFLSRLESIQVTPQFHEPNEPPPGLTIL